MGRPSPQKDQALVIATSTHSEIVWDPVFKTDNLLLVAALATIGIPWKMRKEGTVQGGHHTSDRVLFQLANKVTIAPTGNKGPIVYQTSQLARMLLEGELERIDPEHPLCYAMQAILNRHSLIQHINQRRPVWHFKKSGGPITAIVHDGHEAALDTISRFFKRSGRHAGKPNPLG